MTERTERLGDDLKAILDGFVASVCTTIVTITTAPRPKKRK